MRYILLCVRVYLAMASAFRLAAGGAKVIITGRRTDKLNTVAARIRKVRRSSSSHSSLSHSHSYQYAQAVPTAQIHVQSLDLQASLNLTLTGNTPRPKT